MNAFVNALGCGRGLRFRPRRGPGHCRCDTAQNWTGMGTPLC